MKTISVPSILYIFCLSLLFSLILGCRREVTIALPVPSVEGAPSSATMTTKAIKTEGNKTEFTVDLYVVNKNGRFVTGLQKENFDIASQFGRTFQIEKVELHGLQQVSGGYSALMLFDQSSSMSWNDPQNLRIEAGKYFLDHLGYNDNAAIASFAADSPYYPVNDHPNNTKYHNEFSRDSTYMKMILDSLKTTTNGNTPLYISAFDAIDHTVKNAKNRNKAVIVFADGENNKFAKTLDDVITHAIDQSIPLYTVGLSRSVNIAALSRMATETGGAFFWAQDAKQLISSFSTLGRLLSRNTHLYRTTWTAEKSSGQWNPGEQISGTIKIELPTGETIESPFWITL